MDPTREVLVVAGLKGPVEIVVDRWGVPHIRAGNSEDLFFAQGFNVARDRLWQIDLWRKRGLGLLAADFGPGYLAQDYASRLFLYKGDMAAEWAAYGPDARMICSRFVAGINAYIALTQQDPSRLPPEFAIMHTKPKEWQAGDVVRIRSHGMTRNALSEIVRANVLAATDVATDSLRKFLEPAVQVEVAPDIDLSQIPLEVATLFKLASANVSFDPERLKATPEQAWGWTSVSDLGDVMFEAEMNGSNNWVIAPEKSTSGRPIMANDPHRTHSIPPLRYLAHLTAPGIDVIGAGEPVIPGVSIGHNGHSAFGLTIFYSDQEDVYLYETKSDNPDLYRHNGVWEAVESIDQTFEIAGYPAQVLPLRFTRHGPVLHEEPDNNRMFAVRTVWFEPGSAPYLKSLESMLAKDLPTYRKAMQGWGVPSVNHVYADVSGTIAWVPAGFTPIRAGWNGLLPVPGDGRYDWKGFLDHEQLPRVVDPESGFFATANSMNLPKGFPHEVGYEWIEPSRADRIHQVLNAQAQHSVADSCALQTDTVSMHAVRLLKLFESMGAPAPSAGTEIAAAMILLLRWNGDLSAKSGAAALFEVWWSKHLKPMLMRRLVPNAKIRALLAPGDLQALLKALERPDSRFGPNPRAARDELMRATLIEAWRDCCARMGSDSAQWAWGKLHHAQFDHALSGLLPPADRAAMDVGPFPHGGSSSTPMHTGYRPSDFRTMQGASVRIVVDVGSWDDSRWINAPGQSGDPRSPHYRDLAPIWAEGKYVPMLYSRAAIDAAASHVIEMKPASDGNLPLE